MKTHTRFTGNVFKLTLFLYLLLGVPVIFIVDQLLLANFSYALLTSQLIILVISTAVGHRILLRSMSHRVFYVYCAVLTLATLAASGIFPSIYTQFTNLAVCLIWISSFVSGYILLSTAKEYQYISKMITLLGFVVAGSVVLGYVGPVYLGFSFGEASISSSMRVFGPLGDQVGFILVYFSLRGIARSNWFLFGAALASILLTGTRGAIIVLLFGLVWLVPQLRVSHSNRKYSRFAFAAVAVILITIALTLSPLVEGLLTRFTELILDSDSSLQRRIAMELGLRVYAEHPILGVGYLGFNRIIESRNLYQGFLFGTDAFRGTYTAQNQYIQSATDTGTLGLLALTALLWSLYKQLGSGARWAGGTYRSDLLCAQAWVVAMALGNQAAVWLLPSTLTSYFFFVLMGVSLGLAYLLQVPDVSSVRSCNSTVVSSPGVSR